MNEKEKTLIPWFEVGDSGLHLSADRFCWKVAGDKVLRRGGARDGEAHYKDITYHPKLENALKELLSRKIKGSNAKSVSELLKSIQDTHAWLRREFEPFDEVRSK